jgi:molybdopterin-guanine dinucleotide biosynthesis protein A
MALRVADALAAAGAAEVFFVGGHVDALGLHAIPDAHPGEGPLDGLVTALGAAEHDLVVVLACDLVHPSTDAIGRLVRADPDAAATVPVVAGTPQWLHGAWHRATCLAPLRAAFERGERSIHRAAAALDVRFVDEVGSGYIDADRPEDLDSGG